MAVFHAAGPQRDFAAVGMSTAINWVDAARDRRRSPGRMGGHRPKSIQANIVPWLLRAAEERDFTLRRLVWPKSFAEHSLKVETRRSRASSTPEKLSFKERPWSLANAIVPTSHSSRRSGSEESGQDRPEHLVFIDETWTKTNMAALRDSAPLGIRLPAKVPHGHWTTTTTSWRRCATTDSMRHRC